jgi:pimeloyl-ACP methyl ester carboxylesterase
VIAGLLAIAVAGLVIVSSAVLADPEFAGSSIVVDGVRLRYRQTGIGRDVLLIHGSPGSIEDWEPLTAKLQSDVRVTAFDRPGHGLSGSPRRRSTPQANAETIRELISTLHLNDVVVVGHSFGGSSALALAMTNLPGVRAFVIVSSRVFSKPEVSPLFRLLAVPRLGEGIAECLGPLFAGARIESGIRTAFGPESAAIPAGFIEARRTLWSRAVVTATLSRERVEATAALAALAGRLHEIRKPVFLVYGDADPNAEDGRRLAREIEGATLLVIPNAGHYVPVAHPGELATVIRGALDRKTGAGDDRAAGGSH